MKRIVLHISRTTKWALIVLIFLLAVILTALRLAMPMVSDWRADLEAQLSAIVKAPVTLGSLRGEFRHFNPALTMDSLIVYQPLDTARPSLEFYDIVLELDTLKTILSGSLAFERIDVGRGDLQLTAKDGRLALAGYSTMPSDGFDQPQSVGLPDYRAFYDTLARQQVNIRNLSVVVARPDGGVSTFEAGHMMLSGPANARTLSASIDVGADKPVVVSFLALGTGKEWPNVYVNGYLSLPEFNFQPWLSLLPELPVQLNQLRAGSDVWFSYTPSGWQVRGQLQMSMLDVDLPEQLLPPITNLDTTFFLTFGRHQPHRIWLNELSFQFSGLTYPASDLFLSYSKKPEPALTIAANKVHVQPFAMMVDAASVLPTKFHTVVRELAPRGSLEQFAMEIKPFARPLNMSLSATLKNVAVDGWKGAPAAANINAHARLVADDGVIEGLAEVDSPGLELGLNNLFEDSWVFDKASALVSWRIENEVFRLRSDNIAAQGGEGDIKARLRLDIPFPKEIENWLALEVGFANSDLAYASKYFPVKILSSEMADWLQAGIKTGFVKQGGFILNGSLTKDSGPGTMSWGLFTDVVNADFTYSPDWPPLTNAQGMVVVNQQEAQVSQVSANIYANAHVSDLNVGVTGFKPDQPLMLKVTGAVTGTGQDASQFLRNTPVATAINHAADNWTMTGPFKADLALTLPLSKPKQAKIDVAVALQNNTLVIPQIRAELSQLQGTLNYSSREGLFSPRITGQLQGEPVQAEIHSTLEPNLETTIQTKGMISTQALSKWLQMDVSPYLRGRTSYEANIMLNKGVDVEIFSYLEGLGSPLPAPLGKESSLRRGLYATVEVDPNRPTLVGVVLSAPRNVSTSAELRALMRLDSQGGIERIGLHAGPGAATLPVKGAFVTGSLDHLRLAPWVTWLQQFQQQANVSGVGKASNASATNKGNNFGLLNNLQIRDLTIRNLQWDDNTILTGVRTTIENKPEYWALSLRAAEVTGSAQWPHASDKPAQIVVDRLVIPELSSITQDKNDAETPVQPAEKVDVLAGVNPATLPPMDVNIKSIIEKGRVIGSLEFAGKSVPNGWQIPSLKGSLVNMAISGDLLWSDQNGVQTTALNSYIKGAHIEQLLQLFGGSSAVNAKRFESYLALKWPGSPANFSAESVSGNIGLKMRDGRFDDSGTSGTGALRMFGALNLDAITRRLRLDFSDIYSNGMAFDRLDGMAEIKSGRITLTEPIAIKGPSSDFTLSGQVNIAQKTLDLGLLVTLPVTQNIAVVSLLLGQPYIAGAAYLFDKLLGSTVEHFASLRYEILGSFENPEVKLDSQFFKGEKAATQK